MPTDSPVAGRLRHFGAVVVIAFAGLVAFWKLLGERFSPENYEATPAIPSTVALAWIEGAVVAAVVALVLLVRHRDSWQRLAGGTLPVAAASLLVLIKMFFGARIRMYDMLLFCIACGWTTWLWMRGHAIPENRIGRVVRVAVWSIVVALAAYQFCQQVWYLNNLALGYADCGENARLMFNSMTNPHELFLRVNPDKPLCYDHIDFGIVPFLPLWLLWPDIKLTVLLEIVAVFGVAVPLYWIAKRALRSQTMALLIVLIWVLYPSTSQFIYSASYGFRWGNMCLLLDFVALAFWVYERRAWALASAVWAILIKEEAAIVVGMFGVYLALFERRKVVGVTLAALSFSYFLLATSVLIPVISGENYGMTRFFLDLGQSKWEILLSPLTKPGIFWGKLVEPSSLYFAAALLAPLLFLPLRRPSVMIIGSLTFVFCCMNYILKNIGFHYQAALLPVIFWAFVTAIQQEREHDQRLASLTAAAVSCTMVSLFLGAQPWSKDNLSIHLLPGRLAMVQNVHRQIDPTGSLFATQRAAAHFVTQRYLYLDPPIPHQIDYALLDLRDSWRGSTANLTWLESLRRIQREVEANPNLHLVSDDDGLLFYSRSRAPLDSRKLVERDQLPAGAIPQRLDLSYGISMVAFTVEPMPPLPNVKMDRVRLTAFLTLASRTNVDLAVRCTANVRNGCQTEDSYASEFQPLGQGIWPIDKWETNELYAEPFIISLPAGLATEISTFNFASIPLAP